jgi:phosphatidylglycerophosphatase A
MAKRGTLDKPPAGGYKRRMNLRDRAVLALATGFSVGSIPWAPGTIGTLLGITLCFGLANISLGATVLVIVGFILFAVWVASEAERLLDQKDAPCIVIDEIIGIVVALAGMPMTPLNIAAGFFVFRIFDIVKPFPARYLDARVPGGWGVVMDDVVAGIYSNFFIRVLSSFFFQGAAARTG